MCIRDSYEPVRNEQQAVLKGKAIYPVALGADPHGNITRLDNLLAGDVYKRQLQGRPEQAPELFREHKLAEVSFFGPCRPMMSLIEQQVWLAQGEYVKEMCIRDRSSSRA